MLAFLFGQTFDPHDLAVIGLLVVLEGVLSIDNALVLGLLAKRLPKQYQARALTYGLVGAFVFRVIAIAMATLLMRWWFVKLLGGGYLVYVAVKHLFFEAKEKHPEHVAVGPDGRPILVDDQTGRQVPPEQTDEEIKSRTPVPLPKPVKQVTAVNGRKFWSTVVVIELTDIAFAIDSILAAIALVAGTQKTWIVVTGGMLGVILMRFAAVIFIKLLEEFPRFETAAYLLVTVIGGKLLVDWWFNKPPEGHLPGTPYHGPMDFHSLDSPAFWVFWVLMLACFAIGFIPQRKAEAAA